VIFGYTAGAYDLFHVGHLNILRTAKSMCDRLIVAVSTDELVELYKGHKPIIPFKQRLEIVRGIWYVDSVVRRNERNIYKEWTRIHFNKVFVGDDWADDKQWNEWEMQLKEYSVDIVYLPRTPDISTTTIIQTILQHKRKHHKVRR